MGEWSSIPAGTLTALVTVTVALLARRARHPVTWVLVAYTVTALSLLVDPRGRLWPVWAFMWVPVLLAFPDGFRTSRTRTVGFWYVVGVLALGSGLSFLPGASNPEGEVRGLFGTVIAVLFVPCVGIVVAALISLVRAWSHSEGLRRTRVGVVVAGASLLGAYILMVVFIGVAGAPWSPAWLRESSINGHWGAYLDASVGAMLLLPPIAVGVSMLLEPPGVRLRWVDRVWPWVLTVAAGLLIGGTVWEIAFPEEGAPRPLGAEDRAAGVVGAVSAVIIAGVMVAVRPGGSRVPSAGERASLGLRDLAARLAAAPRPEEVPPLVARTVGQALDLRGTAVDVRTPEGSRRLASWGDVTGTPVVRPLQHAGAEVGSLVLVPHRDGVRVEVAALDGIVPPVAAVVAAARLTQDLAAARDRVLQVREEERARLRADLHDELSPSLAGARLAIAAATDRLPSADTDNARRLLEQSDAELARASGVVRSILEDLRPESLSHHDLVGAIQARAASFDRPGEFSVLVQANSPLPAVNPQVETAVFRIAGEAMANAARHSHGSTAVVQLGARDGGLQLVVNDDGIGLPALPREGVGLGSMADRAAAVGGELRLSAREGGGTSVTGWFPAMTDVRDSS